MEVLARRVAMAERQVARRRARNNKKVALGPEPKPPPEALGDVWYRLKMARITRREDWELGPMAPRRDVANANVAMSLPQHKKPLRAALAGKKASASYKPASWGSVARETGRLEFIGGTLQREDRWAWAGGSRRPNLRNGDRVVIVQGPHKGQIGNAHAVDVRTGTLRIENMGAVNVDLPDHLLTKEHANQSTTMESVFPVSAVRLVHPLEDPETGVTRDVIIKNLVAANYYHDRPSGRRTWDRIVPGLNVKIPWPESTKPPPPDYPGDTLRIEVERKTFVPTLLTPPMPESIIDELRNKFSRFRTRHTDEYVAKIQAEVDAKKARAASPQTMLTPIQEYNRVQRELRAATPPPVLSDGMLAKIGEVMARNRARALAAAGVIAEDPAPSAPAAAVGDIVPPPAADGARAENHPPPS